MQTCMVSSLNTRVTLKKKDGSEIIVRLNDRLVNDNEDNTFNLKGDNNAASLDFEKNISKENIKGRIIFSLNPILFYGIDYGIIIIISSIIVFLVFRKKPS